mmetsp:Transcript_82500/g.237232  ORF Transcript_82500/g.237232 Transcript_82500/m.237232 type:complete len:281 (+) Transcript_82500:2082-2924(+)
MNVLRQVLHRNPCLQVHQSMMVAAALDGRARHACASRLVKGLLVVILLAPTDCNSGSGSHSGLQECLSGCPAVMAGLLAALLPIVGLPVLVLVFVLLRGLRGALLDGCLEPAQLHLRRLVVDLRHHQARARARACGRRPPKDPASLQHGEAELPEVLFVEARQVPGDDDALSPESCEDIGIRSRRQGPQHIGGRALPLGAQRRSPAAPRARRLLGRPGGQKVHTHAVITGAPPECHAHQLYWPRRRRRRFPQLHGSTLATRHANRPGTAPRACGRAGARA